MKKLISLVSSLLILFCAYAQNEIIEKEIRDLEEKQAQAIMKKDSATLRKIWARNFMVNSPRNNVLTGGQVEMVMAGLISYTSYTHDLEKILVTGNIVISMGSETVVPVMGSPKGGQTIKRRYTNIYQRENDRWILIARHANEICQ
ncbi:nuclear transport factor 2 family protein [Ferruginibacter sp.]